MDCCLFFLGRLFLPSPFPIMTTKEDGVRSDDDRGEDFHGDTSVVSTAAPCNEQVDDEKPVDGNHAADIGSKTRETKKIMRGQHKSFHVFILVCLYKGSDCDCRHADVPGLKISDCDIVFEPSCLFSPGNFKPKSWSGLLGRCSGSNSVFGFSRNIVLDTLRYIKLRMAKEKQRRRAC